jgi:light-regulated signal transduction histidine kinase (bacteriophytochrome)
MEDYSEKLDAEGENYLGRILSSAEKMSALIDDMLRLAKISRQEMSLKEIDLTAIAWSIINDLIQDESTRKVEVVIAENLKINGDERLMNIALSNIIGNAWKYSSKVANPRIEFGMTQKDGKKIYYVRDNGAGFDMKYAEKLFTPFQRLHSDREFSGTGIGLPIVKRVIERHGGQIWATGEPGHGATIYFSLP